MAPRRGFLGQGCDALCRPPLIDMTSDTQRNYVETMLKRVSVMMVVMSCLLAAVLALAIGGSRHSAKADSLVDRRPSLDLQWVFQPRFLVSPLGNNCPLVGVSLGPCDGLGGFLPHVSGVFAGSLLMVESVVGVDAIFAFGPPPVKPSGLFAEKFQWLVGSAFCASFGHGDDYGTLKRQCKHFQATR